MYSLMDMSSFSKFQSPNTQLDPLNLQPTNPPPFTIRPHCDRLSRMLWSSWHNHTGDGARFSYCAEPELSPTVYRKALRGGPWQAFAITEHAFALAIPCECEPWPWQWHHTPERLWEHRAFREEKTAAFLEHTAAVCDGKRLFRGLEVEVAWDGTLSMEPLLWPYLDVVIGSIHYLPGEREGWPDAHILQLSTLLAYPIDILGHPFRALAGAGEVPLEIIDETLKLAKDADVAIEINAHLPYAADPLVLTRAVQMGCRIAMGLDAHTRAELALHTYFEQVVKDSDVNYEDIRFFKPVRKSPKPRMLVR